MSQGGVCEAEVRSYSGKHAKQYASTHVAHRSLFIYKDHQIVLFFVFLVYMYVHKCLISICLRVNVSSNQRFDVSLSVKLNYSVCVFWVAFLWPEQAKALTFSYDSVTQRISLSFKEMSQSKEAS